MILRDIITDRYFFKSAKPKLLPDTERMLISCDENNSNNKQKKHWYFHSQKVAKVKTYQKNPTFRHRPHLSRYFWKRDIFSLCFKKNTPRPHVAYSNRFRLSIRKNLNIGNKIASLTEYALCGSKWCMTSFFRPSTRKREWEFLKMLASGERFWKGAFSVTVFTGYVWTVGQTGGKKDLFRFLGNCPPTPPLS